VTITDSDAQRLADLVERIVTSAPFRRSARHPRFLRYIVERASAGDAAALREISLGLEIFGRDPAKFDPQVDPIVRVEAGRLRQKLSRYYENEGRDDELEVTLPVGSYFPVIRKRRAVAADGRPSIAVLPLVNLTGDPGRDSLCEALADSLIEGLGRVPGIKVIARTSAFQFKSERLDARAIGDQLGARMLLHASLQQSLERLTIVTQLVDTTSGDTLWSQLFVGTAADVATIQGTIAHAIMKFLGPLGVAKPIADGSQGDMASITSTTASLEARDLYERGVYLARHGAPAEWTKAIRLLDQSLAVDPEFAAAHAERALALKNLVSSLSLPADQTFAAIQDGIDRALALDPNLAVAHRIKVQLSLLELDWPRALSHARRALEVAPSSAIAHVAYGEWLYTSGRFAEAEREWEIAREFDPLHVSYRSNLALLYALWRRYERSEEILRGILDLDPNHGAARSLLTMLYLMAKRWSKALAEAQESVRRIPNHPGVRLNLAQALAATGDARQARRVLGKCEKEFGADAISPFQRAQLHALLGEVDEAFGQFEHAIARRTTAIYHLPLDPGLESLHADPRWAGMIERHRFPRIDTTGWRAAAIDEWSRRGGMLLSG